MKFLKFNKNIFVQLKLNLMSSFKFLIFLISSCVSLKPPEGGDVRQQGPQIIKKKSRIYQYLYNGAKNVKGRSFRIYFDAELDDINDLREKLVIIPKLVVTKSKKKFKYWVNGKELKIKFNEKLNPNTTYIFNFRDCIKDINTGAISKNLTLMFSTGDKFPMTQIEGTLYDILTNKPEKGLFVSLYKQIDKNIFNSSPDYITIADENGNYLLKYVKPGKYYISASDDINFNEIKNYQLKLTKSGFLEKPIELKVNLSKINIPIVQKNFIPIKIVEKIIKGDHYEIKFNKEIETFNIKLLDSPKNFISKPSVEANLFKDENGKENILRIYNLFYDKVANKKFFLVKGDKPLNIKLDVTDYSKNLVSNTISLSFGRNTKSESFEIKFTPHNGDFIKSNGMLSVQFNKPILSIDPKKIFLVTDDEKFIPIDFKNITLNKFKTKFTIKTNQIIQGVRLKYIFFNDYCVSIEGDKAKAENLAFKILNKENSGIVRGKLGIKAPGGVLIQLLDENYKLKYELKNTTDYQFNYVIPGKYIFRVLTLKTPTSNWYEGDISKRIPPNPVFFLPDIVIVEQGTNQKLPPLI